MVTQLCHPCIWKAEAGELWEMPEKPAWSEREFPAIVGYTRRLRLKNKTKQNFVFYRLMGAFQVASDKISSSEHGGGGGGFVVTATYSQHKVTAL